MLVLRLAYARLDHKFSDSTTGFALFGMDWTPFASSTQANILETEGGMAYFGGFYEREAQIRFGLWHKFGGSRDFMIGIEPAVGMPAFGNNSTDVGDQIGVSERQGPNSAQPDIMGRVVFQWQLDRARGVAPAQIIFSGDYAKETQLVNLTALRNVTCGSAVPSANIVQPPTPNPGAIDSALVYLCPSGVINGLVADFPHGVNTSSTRWGATAEIQLPTRWFTLVGKYYTGADLKWWFGGQAYSYFNDNVGQLLVQPYVTNPATAGFNTILLGEGGGAITTLCSSGNTGGVCPTAFNVDASATTGSLGVPFGFRCTDASCSTGFWQVIPQKPVRGVGGFAQISFPLSRLFNANPAGRNAGWTAAFTLSDDQAKARDVRVISPAGNRNRSDAAALTLVWKFNQYVSFNYEGSLYRTFSTCFPAGTGVPSATNGGTAGGFPGPGGGLICTGTPFIQQHMVINDVSINNGAARAWHDFRNEFGPVFTF